MVKELILSNYIKLNQLDAIAYGSGPGSFTGVRIATSVAQGIGFAAKLPVIPISSLAALAQSAYLENQGSTFFIAVDARMDQIYWAVYQTNQQGYVELIGKEKLCSPGEISCFEIEGYGIGDGWEKYEKILVKRLGFQPEAVYSSQQTTANAIIQLAKIKFEREEWVAPSEAVPVYLR